MSQQLASMATLIEGRRNRLDYLLEILRDSGTRWMPIEVIFGKAAGKSECPYAVDAWDLFRADLDFLEDHDCLVVRDNDVSFVAPAD